MEESIEKVAGKSNQVFCDLFAGTGVVGAYFKQKGYSVIANDIQYYSFVLNKHYIENHKILNFKILSKKIPELKDVKLKDRGNVVCKHLSKIKGKKGFIFENYCAGGKTQRQYFSDENGKKCDAIRQKIGEWKNKKFINQNEYYFLLASLIESIDKYANTASVYGAFLKHLKKSAQKSFELKPAEMIINDLKHKVFNEDINQLVKRVKGDILYLDPPYNHRQYASNYHILETIAKDDNPEIHGKTGLREYENQKSLYCQKVQAKKAFKNLIMNADMKYIFLSYNNEGIMSADDVEEIMSLRGKYGCFTKRYNRFKADRDQNRKFKDNTTTEYLHYVVCK